jgi:hypothetical protein
MKFKTSNGEIVEGPRLQAALETVANFWADNGRRIRTEDLYASHVTAEQKETNLRNQLARAEEIRAGIKINNFTIWQRINVELTGECVAFLPVGV